MPVTTEPMRNGYVTELIERALPYQFGAETALRRHADGVHCSITLPIASGASGDVRA